MSPRLVGVPLVNMGEHSQHHSHTQIRTYRHKGNLSHAYRQRDTKVIYRETFGCVYTWTNIGTGGLGPPMGATSLSPLWF